MNVKVVHQIATRLKLFKVDYEWKSSDKLHTGRSLVMAAHMENARVKMKAYLQAENPSLDISKFAFKVEPEHAII